MIKRTLRKENNMDILNIRTLLRTKSIYDIPLRVTFYARVSTDSEEQINSLDNQISYYEELIQKNKQFLVLNPRTKKKCRFNQSSF